MLHNHSDFDADLEDLSHRVIGSCLAVHRELGAGLVEAAYARAVRVELTASNIPFESEKKYPIVYRGKAVYMHRLDLVVDKRLVVELKCVDCLHPVHLAQIRSCLKVSGLRLGLLVNFNVPLLRQGIQRVVL